MQVKIASTIMVTFFFWAFTNASDLEICCNDHAGMKLQDSDAMTIMRNVDSEELCMYACIDDPTCQASLYHQSDRTCKKHHQRGNSTCQGSKEYLPRQEATNDTNFITYLCRTKALQICTGPLEGFRFLSLSPDENFSARGDDPSLAGRTTVSVRNPVQDCEQQCAEEVGGKSRLAGYHLRIDLDRCQCLPDYPPTVVAYHHLDPLFFSLCKDHFVSCKVKNAKRRNQRSCSRHPGLKLYPIWISDAQILNNIDDNACEQACLESNDCRAANYHAVSQTCGLIPLSVLKPGQQWGRKEWTGILCE